MKLPMLQTCRPSALFGGALLTLTLACVPPEVVGGTVWVSSRPPRPVYERRPPSPGVMFVWIEGYHRWGGSSYEWVPGHWERRPHAHARWHKGKWHRDRRRGWYWVEGHWRY